MNPPGSEMAHRHAYDLLDPAGFWETVGGRCWPCRAPWDRWGDSPYPQQADQDNKAEVTLLTN